MGSMIGQLTAQKYPRNIASLTLFGYPVTLGVVIPDDIQTGDTPRVPTTAEAAASDFIVPLTDHPKHAAYMTYRQELRDYPAQQDFPNGTRPVKP